MVLTIPGPIQALRGMKTPLHHFRRNWISIEAIPLYACIASTCIAGLACAVHAGLGPDIIWTRKVPSLFNTVSQDETPKWGMKLGPRMDASGYPQRAYVKRWTRPEGIAKAKEGKVITYWTQLKEGKNRGGAENFIPL